MVSFQRAKRTFVAEFGGILVGWMRTMERACCGGLDFVDVTA